MGEISNEAISGEVGKYGGRRTEESLNRGENSGVERCRRLEGQEETVRAPVKKDFFWNTDKTKVK
jgi:hypothetical protein